MRNPFWTRAPLALRHFPGLLAAVAAGAFLLALAAAAPSLFTSAAASASLRDELSDTTRYGAGVSLVQRGFQFDRSRPDLEPPLSANREALRGFLAGEPNVEAPVFTLSGAPVTPARSRGRLATVQVRPVARTGALEHITKVAGTAADGFWIAQPAAEQLDVRPGDEISLIFDDAAETTVRIAGIYRPLYSEPSSAYWRSLFKDIYAPPERQLPPPTFLLGEHDAVTRVVTELQQPVEAFAEWPLATTELTLEEAERLARLFERFGADTADPQTAVGREVFCARCVSFRQPELVYDSLLPLAIDQARRTVSTLRGPADLLATAGVIVALAVVAAAGAFGMARRRVEARLLFARGASPEAVVARAGIEALAPALVGAAAGLGAAVLVVSVAGPDGSLERRALFTAAVLAAAVVPVAVGVIAAVSGFSFARHSEAATMRARRLARLPWELAPLVLAGYFFDRLRSGGAFIGDVAQGTGRPSLALLLFPICFIGGLAALAARFLTHPLRWFRARSGPRRDSVYIAVYRLAGARRLALLLVAASALALGIFVYAEALVRSFERAVEIKSLVFVGSDVAGVVGKDTSPPSDFPFPVTKISRANGGAELDGVQADLLAVDSRTFAQAAYWEDAWASRPVGEIVRDLGAGGEARLPVVIAGDAPATTTLEIAGTPIPIQVVERPRVFPTMFLGQPLVVADAVALERFLESRDARNPLDDPGSETSLLVDGESDAAVRALEQSDARPLPIFTAKEARENPSVRAVTNTFAFLKALGLVAGCLAVVGLVLYLQARQRTRVVAYTLSRRMGLRDRTHLTSLVLELGALLLTSLALAAVLGLVAARVVIGDVDPRPRVPPPPLFQAPWLLVAAAVAALAAASLTGAALANRLARRANAAEVMRVAD